MKEIQIKIQEGLAHRVQLTGDRRKPCLNCGSRQQSRRGFRTTFGVWKRLFGCGLLKPFLMPQSRLSSFLIWRSACSKIVKECADIL
jgi:hypothetical protein